MGAILYERGKESSIYSFSNTGVFYFFETLEKREIEFPEEIDANGNYIISQAWFKTYKRKLKNLARKLEKENEEGFLLGPLEELIRYFEE